MHKMKISFYENKATDNSITAETIVSEVEDLGFGAKLIAEHRLQPEQSGSNNTDTKTA